MAEGGNPTDGEPGGLLDPVRRASIGLGPADGGGERVEIDPLRPAGEDDDGLVVDEEHQRVGDLGHRDADRLCGLGGGSGAVGEPGGYHVDAQVTTGRR